MEYQKSPIAFVIAFILAPVLVFVISYALMTSGLTIFFFGVGAAIYGAPFYILLGGPACWYAYKNNLTGAGNLAGLAFMANVGTFVAAPLILFTLFLIQGWDMTMSNFWGSLALGGLGCVFAPLWGAITGWLYNGFLRLYGREKPADAK